MDAEAAWSAIVASPGHVLYIDEVFVLASGIVNDLEALFAEDVPPGAFRSDRELHRKVLHVVQDARRLRSLLFAGGKPPKIKPEVLPAWQLSQQRARWFRDEALQENGKPPPLPSLDARPIAGDGLEHYAERLDEVMLSWAEGDAGESRALVTNSIADEAATIENVFRGTAVSDVRFVRLYEADARRFAVIGEQTIDLGQLHDDARIIRDRLIANHPDVCEHVEGVGWVILPAANTGPDPDGC